MQIKKRLLGGKKLFSLQVSNLQRYWDKARERLFLQKRDTQLEITSGRRNLRRHTYQKARRIWSTIYERTRLEKILQSRKRSEEIERIRRSKNEAFEGRDSSTRQREERRITLAKLFEREDFKLFVEWLASKEDETLNQLVIPTAKPNSEMSYENYSWYLRGELNAYLQIRSKIESDIFFKNKKLIENTEGGEK